MAGGETSQVKKVKININDRDFFLGLVQGGWGDAGGCAPSAATGAENLENDRNRRTSEKLGNIGNMFIKHTNSNFK